MTDVNVSVIPPTLKFLNSSLQEINFLATQLCQTTIRHSSENKKNITPGVPVDNFTVPAEDFENLSIKLLDLSSKISSCQGVVTKMIGDITNGAQSNSDSVESTPTEVTPGTEMINARDQAEPVLIPFTGISIESVVSQHIGNHGILKAFGKGLDDYVTETSTLPKFQESVDLYTPDQIVNWPDGWYRANNTSHRELLLTLDSFGERDRFTPRILIKYNLHELVSDKMIQVYIADGSVWKREEQFSNGVLKIIKNKIVLKSRSLKNKFSNV